VPERGTNGGLTDLVIQVKEPSAAFAPRISPSPVTLLAFQFSTLLMYATMTDEEETCPESAGVSGVSGMISNTVVRTYSLQVSATSHDWLHPRLAQRGQMLRTPVEEANCYLKALFPRSRFCTLITSWFRDLGSIAFLLLLKAWDRRLAPCQQRPIRIPSGFVACLCQAFRATTVFWQHGDQRCDVHRLGGLGAPSGDHGVCHSRGCPVARQTLGGSPWHVQSWHTWKPGRRGPK